MKDYELRKNQTHVMIHADNIDSKAHDQLKLIANHPSVYGLVAAMPDTHPGAGCVIGFTGHFRNSIIPSVIGVDIGCGVLTYNLGDIPLDLPAIYAHIKKNIPSGRNSHLHRVSVNDYQNNTLEVCEAIVNNYKLKANPTMQVGTLGGGNHFIEIEKGKKGYYLTIHTGSRKFGHAVASYYQAKAKELVKKMNVSVPQDLEYLPLGAGSLGEHYMWDMRIAQKYAHINREMILQNILSFIGVKYDAQRVIESVHNYISEKDNIARKGAISAYEHEPVVIPLNMADGIIIGTGKSNKNYNFSAPHGAGRVSGRKVMKEKLKNGVITMEAFEKSMEGIYTEAITPGTVDESKFAYKPLESILKYLEETVTIEDIAVPVLSFKDVE